MPHRALSLCSALVPSSMAPCQLSHPSVLPWLGVSQLGVSSRLDSGKEQSLLGTGCRRSAEVPEQGFPPLPGELNHNPGTYVTAEKEGSRVECFLHQTGLSAAIRMWLVATGPWSWPCLATRWDCDLSF